MPQTETKPEIKFKESNLSVSIHGLIQTVEQIKSDRGDFYATTLVIPAKDRMTNPKRITVFSSMPIGAEDTIVDSDFFLNSTFKNNNGKWFNRLTLWNEKRN